MANAEDDLLYQAAALAGMSSWDLYRDHSPNPRTLVQIQYDDLLSTSSESEEGEQREESVERELGESPE